MPRVGMRNDHRLIELVAQHHHLASMQLVRRAGLTEHQWELLLEHDAWVPVVPGLWRHEANPLTWEMKVHAGARWLGKDAALHGATAVRWWGVEGVTGDSVEFIVPRARRFLAPWLVIHTTLQWTRGDVLRRNGVPTCSVTRAIIDLARTASARELETVIDSGIRLRRTSVPTLTKRMSELGGRGRNGIVRLRELLLDSGGESRLERRFLRLMRLAGLPRPVPQVVHRPSSGKVIRVDFEFPGTEVVVEVSGRRGHSSDSDRQKDARRRNALVALGKAVIEFTTADVIDDPDYVITTIATHLPARFRDRVMSPPANRR